MSSPLPEEVEDRLYSLRPLRLYLTLWMGPVYVWGLLWEYTLNNLVLFTILMIIHGVGYWFSLSLSYPRRRLWLFCGVQGAMVMVISLVTRNPLVTLMLYMELIGAAVVLGGHARSGLLVVIGYLIVGVPNFLLLRPGNNWYVALLFNLPVAPFVVGAALLFLQQANDRLKARTLLRELEAAHRQLAEYADRVEDLTLAAERQRMARELHDTLAQGLAGMILQLEAANSHLTTGKSDKGATLKL